METTGIFAATVKMLKSRNKNLQASAAMSRPRMRETCHFTQQAKSIVKDLTQLRDFLINCRRSYISLNHALDGSGSMSDYERDQIDTQSQTVLKTCGYVLKNLRNSVKLEKCSSERYEHRQAMVELVSAYLAAVESIYVEQQAIRMSRRNNVKNLYRLENLIKFTEAIAKRQESVKDVHRMEKSLGGTVTPVDENRSSPAPQKESPQQNKTIEQDSSGVRRRGVPDRTEKPKPKAEEAMKQRTKKNLALLEDDVKKQEEEWTNFRENINPEEKVQLQAEQKQLLQELRSKADEIQMLEGKVMEIAHLQDIFTTKVLEQEQDIYRINTVAIHTTENIKAANDYIREAMKRKAGFRVYILFFLIVMSLTLWFLDWYNP